MVVSQHDVDAVVEELVGLCAIPSPTGYTHAIQSRISRKLKASGLKPMTTVKGSLVVPLGGEGDPLVLSAHFDTLGAMVRSIRDSGRLRLTPIGSFPWNHVEAENCLIHTRSGTVYEGCIQLTSASVHVFPGSEKTERSDANVEVFLDEPVFDKADAAKLGIRAGDFVSFDPRTAVTKSGFIKSRHLDDKAGLATLLRLALLVGEGRITPARRVTLVLTSWEEVGHGGSAGIPQDTREIIGVDMGAVGDDLETNEFKVSICAKDSGGPYDYDVTSRLIRTAEEQSLPFATDIYPSYRSDVSAALVAGCDARHGLLGPGVFASHGYERTHRSALEATLALLAAYVERPVER